MIADASLQFVKVNPEAHVATGVTGKDEQAVAYFERASGAPAIDVEIAADVTFEVHFLITGLDEVEAGCFGDCWRCE